MFDALFVGEQFVNRQQLHAGEISCRSGWCVNWAIFAFAAANRFVASSRLSSNSALISLRRT
jgi:hypothetical protein